MGFGIYKEISKINTDTANEIVKKKSKIPLGSGIIIIKRIANTKNTTPKSLASLNFSFNFTNLSSSFSSL